MNKPVRQEVEEEETNKRWTRPSLLNLPVSLVTISTWKKLGLGTYEGGVVEGKVYKGDSGEQGESIVRVKK